MKPSNLEAVLVVSSRDTQRSFNGGTHHGTSGVSHREAVDENRPDASQTRQPRQTLEGKPRCFGRHPLGPSDRREVEGSSRAISEPFDLLAAIEAVGGGGNLGQDLAGVPLRVGHEGPAGLERGVHGRDIHSREKRGFKVGKTKRGKGTKLMVVADGKGVPMGVSIHSASPAEVKLAPETLATVAVPRGGPGRPRRNPERLIADKAYDSDPLRKELAVKGIELVCPHRLNRTRPATQDGRALRRYAKRWKIERTISWLGNYRRVIVRWDRSDRIFQAFVHLACLLTVLNHL